MGGPEVAVRCAHRSAVNLINQSIDLFLEGS
ncbi:hypothetical protein X942_5847 [Burkholderia pseudomallei MSHR5596]|nr:hypothetical protein X942_5847 [Burkholderia pseudomallei MSHR5596]